MLGDRIKAAAAQGRTFASLSEAADELDLYYSKSNVFRALEELRDVYDRGLVNRGDVTLSPEGEIVYAWAKALLELHARGKQWPIGGREQVHIGASSWILHFLVPEIVRGFLADRAEQKEENRDLPDVDLAFSEYDLEQVLVALRKGAIHAGLAALFMAGSLPGIDVQSLREGVSTLMIASSQHERWGHRTRQRRNEVALAELAAERICVIEADLYRVLASLPAPAPGGGRVLVENYATVAALVRSGAAVGFLPQLHRGPEPDHPAYQGLEVYSIKEGKEPQHKIATRTLAILRRANDTLPEPVEEFLAVAADLLR
jgi:DNA-binding transcriptional LysR family regulator